MGLRARYLVLHFESNLTLRMRPCDFRYGTVLSGTVRADLHAIQTLSWPDLIMKCSSQALLHPQTVLKIHQKQRNQTVSTYF